MGFRGNLDSDVALGVVNHAPHVFNYLVLSPLAGLFIDLEESDGIGGSCDESPVE